MAVNERSLVRTNGRGVYFTLTQLLIKHCWWVAHRRFERGRFIPDKYGLGNERLSDEEKLERDFLGACCECAVAEMLAPCHWNLFEFGKPDIIMPNGLKIDVKGVPYDSYHLAIGVEYDPRHVYAMVSAECHPAYWMAGWAYGWELRNEWFGRLRADRNELYIVPHEERRKWHELERLADRSRGR